MTPDFDGLIKEMAKHPSLTRKVLWDEYKEQFGDQSYSYSQFCVLMRSLKVVNSLTMHLEHLPGYKLFVDFGGDRVPIYSSMTSEKVTFEASIFVGVLAYSGVCYAYVAGNTLVRFRLIPSLTQVTAPIGMVTYLLETLWMQDPFWTTKWRPPFASNNV
ncbi:transposase [Acidithrix sp. C25]|uniref:transposase n=1 Tax=Acidithrix sp. C25 TaxID=1671482 RepID=UPI00191BB309|nr:transposase [Acidithrix sp. C25]